MYKKVITIILLLLVFFPCNVFAKDNTLKDEVIALTKNYYIPIETVAISFHNMSKEHKREQSKTCVDKVLKKLNELEKTEVSTPLSEYKQAVIVFSKVSLEYILHMGKADDTNYESRLEGNTLIDVWKKSQTEVTEEFRVITGVRFNEYYW